MAPVNCLGVTQCAECIKLGCSYAIFKQAVSTCVLKMEDILDKFADVIEPGEKCPNSPPPVTHSSSWIYVGVGIGGAVLAIAGIVGCYYGIKKIREIRSRRRRVYRSARLRGFTNHLMDVAARTGVQFSSTSGVTLLELE